MSGSLGTCPISPAAKPAKPAPSSSRPSKASRDPTGTSFALGLAYMSTNCANTNSIPRASMSFHTESADATAVAAIRASSGVEAYA